jgi:hypothetical protein
MSSIDKFINHFTKNKILFSMWHLGDNGELQLHKINFSKEGTWKWQIDHTIKIISLSDIKTMLPKYLLNYDISWDDLLNCSDTVFLTYGYSEEEGEEKKPISSDYRKPFRAPAYIGSSEDNMKDEVSKILHKKYVEDVKLYNIIRKSVFEEIKRINPTRASEINLEIKDDPNEISYLVDIKDVS